MDLHTYSNFVYETIEFYLNTLKEVFISILTWLYKKIFGDEIQPDQDQDKTFCLLFFAFVSFGK